MGDHYLRGVQVMRQRSLSTCMAASESQVSQRSHSLGGGACMDAQPCQQ